MSQFKEGAIHQLANALENAGYTDDDVTKLRQGDLPGIQMVIRGRAQIVLIEPEPLLKLVGTVTVPATTEKFIARDRFIVDTSGKARVKIAYLGDYFKERFLGKIEGPISETTLRYQELRKASADDKIIAELGGKEKIGTTLAEMFSQMEAQGNGEDGHLLTDGRANIFYVPDIGGVLQAVDCFWDGDGWNVNAYSVENPFRWHEGSRVFSRNLLAA